MWVGPQDHYALLGVTRYATVSELRRAYRILALRHHPDRAGAASTLQFQKIAEAYRILSNPGSRAAYDRRLREAEDAVASVAQDEQRARFRESVVQRLSGPLDRLVRSAVARRTPDGAIELLLNPAEAEAGGTAAVEVPVPITCPTCAGVAAEHRVWCCRCDYAGSIIDVVTIAVEIPPLVPDRMGFLFPTDPAGVLPPLRVRVRVV